MKLNRTGSNWNRLERNKINENWDIIEGGYNDVVGQITDEVVGHLIDSARLDWKEPVETEADLPKDAEVGETRMVRESDDGVSHVYRYNGEKWELIQEIDVSLVNEVDRRLTAQLAQTWNEVRPPSEILDDNHESMMFIGNWVESNSDDYYGGSSKRSNVAGDYLECIFVGTGVRLIGMKANDSGHATVYIDGKDKGIIDFYSENSLPYEIVFEIKNLPFGQHNIKIEVNGNKSPSSSGDYIRIDALEVLFNNRINNEFQEINNIKNYNVNAESPLMIPTYDDSYQTVHPKVLYFPNRWEGFEYWMVHTPYTNTNDKVENPSIVVSHDGYTWLERAGLDNPISGVPNPDGYGHYSDGHLVMVNRVLECWYRYNPPNAGDTDNDNDTNIIYRQTSTDGVNWSQKEEIFSGSKPFVSPSVIYEDGKYKMWYHDYSGGTYYRESTDAVSWSPEQEVTLPLPPGVWAWHSDVIHEDNYEMVVSCGGKGTYELYYAKSTDGITFESAKKIITPTYGTDRLDNLQIYRASILKVNGLYKIYYSARNNNDKWHIFLTEGYTIDSLQGYDNHEFRWKMLWDNLQLLANKFLYLGNARLVFENGRLFIGGGDSAEISSVDGRLLITKDGAYSAYLDYDGLNFQSDKNGSYHKDGISKYQKNGVGAVIVKFDEKQNTLVIRNQTDNAPGYLSTGGVFLEKGGSPGNIEGAMRYNANTKKIEFYNGSKWETIQSSS